MTAKLIALVLPLGLGTFAVAAAVGMLGATPATRRRVSLLFPAFEAAVPLIGVALVIALIAIQAVIVTQLGPRLGHRLSERLREGAERLAGLALTALAIVLLAEKLLAQDEATAGGRGEGPRGDAIDAGVSGAITSACGRVPPPVSPGCG